MRTDPGYLRERVYERDRGICSRCGLDTVEFYRRLRVLPAKERRRLRSRLDLPATRTSFWDADHVLAVAEGGGECDLDNMRTLCLWCHGDATAALRQRMRARKRPAPRARPRSLEKARTR